MKRSVPTGDATMPPSRTDAKDGSAAPAGSDAQAARGALHGAHCVHSAAAVHTALDRMAAEISVEIADRDPLLLGVMTGGMWPLVELSRRLEFPHRVDFLHASRYRGKTRGGALKWRLRPRLALADRHVLIVDDILDEGHTLAAVVDACVAAGAARVLSAVLVTKRHDRPGAGLAVDFSALEVPDAYVFGCGMDLHEYWRGLPAIYAVAGSDGDGG